MEVDEDDWDWRSYLGHATRMQDDHQAFISEFNSNRKRTVGLNDISIVALACTLGLPLISSEGLVHDEQSSKVRRIPNICRVEGVQHLSFNDFLRREGITV
jgi:hypothetical protein